MAYRCKLDQGQECDGCGFCTQEQDPEEEKEKECCATCSCSMYWWGVKMVCMNKDSNYYKDIIKENHSCADYKKEGEE